MIDLLVSKLFKSWRTLINLWKTYVMITWNVEGLRMDGRGKVMTYLMASAHLELNLPPANMYPIFTKFRRTKGRALRVICSTMSTRFGYGMIWSIFVLLWMRSTYKLQRSI
eukprot:TRINITY_DN15373_c0_g1_i1.p2 TRINITY_DN15373_c0_g1~~TRINITY_DN15373_c0_g1_i1.p2  ORF type:complete len:111 (+),score=8.71 TRINITY_DN15373_c0_g1_i1:3-335(+)